MQGSYSLSVDAIRGDDMASLRAAPGDFVYVGTDGRENYLITHGELYSWNNVEHMVWIYIFIEQEEGITSTHLVRYAVER